MECGVPKCGDLQGCNENRHLEKYDKMEKSRLLLMRVMHYEYEMKWKERKMRLECQVRDLLQLGK